MSNWNLPEGPFTTVVADPPWRFRGAQKAERIRRVTWRLGEFKG